MEARGEPIKRRQPPDNDSAFVIESREALRLPGVLQTQWLVERPTVAEAFPTAAAGSLPSPSPTASGGGGGEESYQSFPSRLKDPELRPPSRKPVGVGVGLGAGPEEGDDLGLFICQSPETGANTSFCFQTKQRKKKVWFAATSESLRS